MISYSQKILITGSSGLVGKNLITKLEKKGYQVLGLDSKNDLRSPSLTRQIFKNYKPSIVFHLAAKVGGIYANSNYKADFYSDNVLINTNVVNACVENNVEYIFAMGTGCAYPKKLENNVLYEEDFLDGIPEITNDAYAYAKRGLLVHLKSLDESKIIKYTFCLPANIYGPFDNFHPLNSHVVPGLIRRFCDSVDKDLEDIYIWGDGSARRDFLFIDDCIDAMIKLAEIQFKGPINVSSKSLTSIKELAELIKIKTSFKGSIIYDKTKLIGQKQRIMDTSKMDHLDWLPRINLEDGISKTIKWFRENRLLIRER